MGLDVEKLSKEELEELLEKIKAKLKPKKERKSVEIPEDVKKLMEEYEAVNRRRKEILEELKSKGFMPKGVKRKGYGEYNYRGTGLYNTVEEIIKSRGNIGRDELIDELNKKGYAGSGGSLGIVIRNLKEDGKITVEGGRFIWIGSQG